MMEMTETGDKAFLVGLYLNKQLTLQVFVNAFVFRWDNIRRLQTYSLVMAYCLILLQLSSS